MKGRILLVVSFFVMIMGFTLIGYECILDQQAYIQRLEKRIEESDKRVNALEKELHNAEKHMDNIVRCIVSGEW